MYASNCLNSFRRSQRILDLPIELQSIRTSSESGPFREFPSGDWHLDPGQFPKLDFTTLVYDIARSENRNIVLYCPRLYNLYEFLIGELSFRGGRAPSGFRRQRFGQWERLEIKDSATATEIWFAGEPHLVRERPTHFDGCNVLVTMNKDNPIDWIVDWARYHNIHHAAEAALIFDNGSTGYSRSELERELIDKTNLSYVSIVCADLPYGWSRNLKNGSWQTQYLQSACLNLAREIFLAKANAVLSIDIDEFVEPLPKTNVFILTKKSLFGQLVWKGTWAFCSVGSGPMPQKEHDFVSELARDSSRKFCTVPNRFLGKMEWLIHGHFGLYGLLTSTKRVHHWHFRRTNTSWKGHGFGMSDFAKPSAELVAALARL